MCDAVYRESGWGCREQQYRKQGNPPFCVMARHTTIGNAKRLTSIQVFTTAIWRPKFRERITVPTNRMNLVRNQFQPGKGSYKLILY